MRRFLLSILICSLLLGCFSGALAEGQFRVGMECDYAPYNWTQTEETETSVPIEGGGYADGYDVQIAKKIAEGLGKELVIVKTEWDGLPMGVMSGKLDAIIAGMSPTEERKLTIDFTDVYYESDLVVVVRKDGAFANAASIADFAGAKLTGQQNTFHYTVIDQIEGVVKEPAMTTFATMIVALSSGKIDGYISELPGARSAIASNPDLTYVQFEEGNGFSYSADDANIAIGLAKGSELLQPINDILATITAEDRTNLMAQAVENQPLAE